jgi:hypothetical protein
MSLKDRIVPNSWNVTLLAIPKRDRPARALGFLGGVPAAQAEAGPCWWPGGRYKALPLSAPLPQMIHAHGRGMVGNSDQCAVRCSLAEDGTLSTRSLGSPSYSQCTALGCDDTQQVGSGTPAGNADARHALLWAQDAETPIVLKKNGAGGNTSAIAVEAGVQGGCFWAGAFSGVHVDHACFWRGNAESLVDLHPKDAVTSSVWAVGGGEQVGHFVTESGLWKHELRAALWRGSADSFVDLTPAGARLGTARACAAGLQVGMVREAPLHPARAILWGGRSDDIVDLHAMLPGPWDISYATRIAVDGDRLLVMGDVAVAMRGRDGKVRGEGDMVPVLWEARLTAAGATQTRQGPVEHIPELFTKAAGSSPNVDATGASAEALIAAAAAKLELLAQESADDTKTFVELGPLVEQMLETRDELEAALRGLSRQEQRALSAPHREKMIQAAATLGANVFAAKMRDRAAGRLPPVTPSRAGDGVADMFAVAIIQANYEAAHELLAPWLQPLWSASLLRERVEAEYALVANSSPAHVLPPPGGYQASASHLALGEIRRNATIADEVTEQNFVGWRILEISPEEEDSRLTDVDILLSCHMAIVKIESAEKIGYLEFTQ